MELKHPSSDPLFSGPLGCMRFHGVFGLLFLLALIGSGCQSSTPSLGGAARPAGQITRLYIMSLPIGLNLDQTPGTDGFAMKVYAASSDDPKSKPITKGAIDILMFDGTVKNPASTNPPPHKIWSFHQAELLPLRVESAIGTAYNFTINWSDSPPATNKISVAARYRLPPSPDVYSSVTTINVGGQ